MGKGEIIVALGIVGGIAVGAYFLLGKLKDFKLPSFFGDITFPDITLPLEGLKGIVEGVKMPSVTEVVITTPDITVQSGMTYAALKDVLEAPALERPLTTPMLGVTMFYDLISNLLPWVPKLDMPIIPLNNDKTVQELYPQGIAPKYRPSLRRRREGYDA